MKSPTLSELLNAELDVVRVVTIPAPSPRSSRDLKDTFASARRTRSQSRTTRVERVGRGVGYGRKQHLCQGKLLRTKSTALVWALLAAPHVSSLTAQSIVWFEGANAQPTCATRGQNPALDIRALQKALFCASSIISKAMDESPGPVLARKLTGHHASLDSPSVRWDLKVHVLVRSMVVDGRFLVSPRPTRLQPEQERQG